MALAAVPAYPTDEADTGSAAVGIDLSAVVKQIAKEAAHPEYLVFQGQLGAPKIPLPSANAYGKSQTSRQQLNIWDLINDAVDGTGGFMDGSYLVPHELELLSSALGSAWATKFATRMQLARYDNFVKSICDGPWNTIIGMSDQIKRDAGEHERLKEFWDDVDGSGTSINDFLEYPVSQARRFGTGWIFMDRARKIANMKDDLAAQPWAYTVPTRNVVWWQYNKRGGLELLAYRDPVADDEKSWESKEAEPLIVWTRSTYTRWIPANSKESPYELDGSRSGANALGVIPSVQIFDEQPACGKAFGKANMLTNARAAVDVFNRDSEIREIERMAAFPLLHVNIDDIADAGEVNIGLKGVLITDGTISPSYLEPALNSIDKLQSESKRVKEDARVNSEMAGLIAHTAQDITTTSGAHSQVELDKSERRIGKVASSVETADNRMAKLFLLMVGEPDEGYSISYPRKFGLTNADTVIDRTKNRLDLNLGKDDQLEVLRDYYAGMYPRKTQKEIEELAQKAAEARANAPAPFLAGGPIPPGGGPGSGVPPGPANAPELVAAARQRLKLQPAKAKP